MSEMQNSGPAPTVGTEEPKRGGCLTAFLVLMFIVNPLTALTYLFIGGTVLETYPALAGWGLPVLIVLSLANVAFAVALWKWKRWGAYGFAANSLIALVVNLIGGVGVTSFGGLIGLAILAFLLRDVWQHMD